MYQFTTTTVINSNLDSNGTTAKYAGTATDFKVTRVNTFKKANILSVYKRPYQAGVKETATIINQAATAGDVIRLEVDIRLAQQTNSEYANTYLYFKKPVFVEVIYETSAIVTATKLVAAINGLKDRFGFSYITASNASGSSATITLTATDNNQRFYAVYISKENLTPNSIIQPDYTLLAGGIAKYGTTVNNLAITVQGVIGFGDDDWMARAIVLPTAENVRYFGINKEGRPVIGGNYTQYTLKYSIDKEDSIGIVAEGKSITTHVFYVISTLVSAFEDALETTFPGIITVGGTAGPIIISGDEQLDLSLAETTTMTATNYTGTITWTSGTAGTATINSSTGVVTAVGVGSTVITATDTAGKTGTFTLRVVA